LFACTTHKWKSVANVEMLPVTNVASSNWNWILGVAALDIGNIHKFIQWQVVTISLDGHIIDS